MAHCAFIGSLQTLGTRWTRFPRPYFEQLLEDDETSLRKISLYSDILLYLTISFICLIIMTTDLFYYSYY